MAGGVWILTALINLTSVVSDLMNGQWITFLGALRIECMAILAVLHFIDGDRAALYYASVGLAVSFIYAVAYNSWVLAAETVMIAIFTYLPIKHLIKDGIRDYNERMTEAARI